MGLVDYSDSESDSEPQSISAPAPKPKPQPAPNNATAHPSSAPAPPPKKPFQKLLDRSNPGQIRVSLPPVEPSEPSEEPPAKRARTTGQSAFADFNSFLPAPKKAKAAPSRTGASRPVGLKTSSDAAFQRLQDDDQSSYTGGGAGLSLPPPKNRSSGSNTNGVDGAPESGIAEGQKRTEEVKLVGKPLMFKPLSVARRPGQKKKTATEPAPKTVPTTATATTAVPEKEAPKKTETPPPAKKPAVSLFSLDDPADEPEPAPAPTRPGVYEPIIATKHTEVTGPYESEAMGGALPHASYQPPSQPAAADSLDAIADSMNLTPAQRRELFGRGGPGASSRGVQSVVNVNMDREYASNEALRASGEVVQHNPLRSIQPGKHSLKQLVNAVQNQKDALEENFAKGKSNQREAAGRYGWK